MVQAVVPYRARQAEADQAENVSSRTVSCGSTRRSLSKIDQPGRELVIARVGHAARVRGVTRMARCNEAMS